MPHPTEELDPDIYKLYAPENLFAPSITWEQAMLAQIMRDMRKLTRLATEAREETK